ncbi:MAG: hypothetical protein IT384_10525 [Deltaproteobacteria bacterium]|nr:hypothetical protein [Deltaproteobacteria bacterium]
MTYSRLGPARAASLHAIAAGLSAALLAPPAGAQVSGTARDAQTLAALPGARVSVQASAVETTADASGAFDLPAASGDVVVVAAMKGYFNAGAAVTAPAAGVDLLLERVPQADDPSYAFVPPGACAMCHPDQFDAWLPSPMSQAGLNTWVYDTYDGSGTPGGMGGFVYTRDSVLAASNPASECASCHQPEPWVESPYGPLGPLAVPTAGMLHGVSCEICHKIANIDETRPNFPGIWPGVVTLTRPQGFQVQYGVLGDTTYSSSGEMRSSYQPQLTAAVCAACHQDKNDPDEDGDFEEPDGVISEPTYLEWLATPYADPASPMRATCVDCHMPATGAPDACNTLPASLGRPAGDVRSHAIAGTTPEYLDNAVTLSLAAALAGGSLAVDVTVTNDLTGHHVPTGVTIRNVILVVEAVGPDGAPLEATGDQTVHDLGGVGDPAQGYYAGLPGKLYAKVNHDASGAGPTFFTDAAGITFDTRIPALTADATHYTFQPPEAGGEVSVRARLIYRRSWRALVDAKGWTEDGHGNPLEDVAPPHFGHLMEEAETTVTVPPPAPCDGGPCPECAIDTDCPDGQACEAGQCVDRPGEGGGGSAPASPSPGEDGCGCRLAAPPAHGGALLLALALAALARRRAR